MLFDCFDPLCESAMTCSGNMQGGWLYRYTMELFIDQRRKNVLWKMADSLIIIEEDA